MQCLEAQDLPFTFIPFAFLLLSRFEGRWAEKIYSTAGMGLGCSFQLKPASDQNSESVAYDTEQST
jgi:hypothetical protein